MNQNTKLLILLIALTLGINYYNYANQENDKLASNIKMLENRILKEVSLAELISHKEKDLSTPKYEEMLYPQNLKPTQALGKMQTFIEATAKESGVKLSSINWGEPYVLPKMPLRVLPIRFSAMGKPFRLRRFALMLRKHPKIVKSESISLVIKKKQETLSVRMQLQMFQKVSDAK